MELKRRFLHIIEDIKTSKKKRVNEILKPSFISSDSKSMSSVIAFPHQDWTCNQRGQVHGGSICSMFDIAMGITVLTHLDGDDVATTELHATYIRPFDSEEYVFESTINNLGRSMVRISCVAKDGVTGKVLATATATYIPVPKTK